MKPRLLLALGLVLGCVGQGAWAQGFADSVVGQLRAQGFDRIEVERTMLGRVRIQADHADGSREIILNPRTGEILRDLWIGGSDNQPRTGKLVSDDEGDDGGKGRGRGRGSDDDDGDDDNGSGDDSDSGGDSNGGGDDD
jgi:hypothetical protein